MTQDRVTAMKEIQDEVNALPASPLYAYRREHDFLPVIGEGSLEANVLFVGEAPGKKEALSGKPFCGSAGKTLDMLLESVNLERSDVYITNIVKDRPPENRDPAPEEIACYAPFLDRQIAIIQPRVIVTLGRYAMKYILERFECPCDDPIGEAHGNIYEATASYGPIRIIPQYHPAAAIYNRKLIETLKEDFKTIKTAL